MSPKILGVGPDNNLMYRDDLTSAWVEVPNSGSVIAIAAMPEGRLLGVGADTQLYTRDTLNSPWQLVPNSGSVIGIAVEPSGRIIGVGSDRNLWYRDDLTSAWVQVPNSGSVIAIAAMPEGRLLGVGADTQLYTRDTLNSPWQLVPNSGSVIGIAVEPSGRIIGVGSDRNLWYRDNLTSAWVQVPNSGPVIAIAINGTAAAAPGASTAVAVSAQQPWVDTGVDLNAGDALTISANGTWTNGGNPPVFIGPDGYAGYKNPDATLGSANFASLIGKVGDQVFFVGSAYKGTSPGTGRLYLQINDLANSFADNNGKLDVEVQHQEEAVSILNGSFEEGPDPGAWFIRMAAGDTRIVGWTVGGGGIDYTGTLWQPGDTLRRSIDLDADLRSSGSIEQTIRTTPGATYKVTWAMAGNPDAGPTTKTMTVKATGGTEATYSFDAQGKSRTNMGWIEMGYTFTATSSSTVLKFTSTTGSGYGPAIDHVQIVRMK